MVSFSEAIYERDWQVEGIWARRIDGIHEAHGTWQRGMIPVLVDPEFHSRSAFQPEIIVDATMAKRNLGTSIAQAELVIALGPGFTAGRDAHLIVETHRGHNLGRIIHHGTAFPDTGIPGDIKGKTSQRVLRAPKDGIFESELRIGSSVTERMIVGRVGPSPVVADIGGVLRGLIRPGTLVSKGLKIGDVDPRGERSYCFTVSEKARALGGSVLEAILNHYVETHVLKPELD
jgi:xanthine dehydrogenase accessory factor